MKYFLFCRIYYYYFRELDGTVAYDSIARDDAEVRRKEEMVEKRNNFEYRAPLTRVSRLLLADQFSNVKTTSNLHSKDNQGRYIVKLPFKSIENLRECHTKALRFAIKLRNQFETNADYARAYSDFLNEYERLQLV